MNHNKKMQGMNVILLFGLILLGNATIAKLRTNSLQSDPRCPSDLGHFAGFTLTTNSHYCHDPSFAMPDHTANIEFSAKNNDWYIGLFDANNNLVYFLVFAGWSNSYTRLLYANGGAVDGCESPMTLTSGVFYDYHVVLTPGQVLVTKDGEEAFRCNVNPDRFSNVVSYGFSCYCTSPSDLTVTFKDFETRPANPSDLGPPKRQCRRRNE
jgi:hypothetical protein